MGMMNIFDTIDGLPVHALIVHATVILLPLSALALLAVIFVRRWRRPYAWLAVAGTVIGTGAAGISVLSGRQLATHVGTPDRHAQLGTLLTIVAVVLSLVALGWWLLQRRTTADTDSLAIRLLGSLTAVLAAAALTLTVLVGHSGAQAAWGGRISAAESTSTSDASTPASSESSSAPADDSTVASEITLDEVAQHASVESCWAAVDGNVYDLTSWIDQHPGGRDRIIALCGTDATEAFSAQHSSNEQANNQLAELQIGQLA